MNPDGIANRDFFRGSDFTTENTEYPESIDNELRALPDLRGIFLVELLCSSSRRDNVQ